VAAIYTGVCLIRAVFQNYLKTSL